jgi:hypothetical protein
MHTDCDIHFDYKNFLSNTELETFNSLGTKQEKKIIVSKINNGNFFYCYNTIVDKIISYKQIICSAVTVNYLESKDGSKVELYKSEVKNNLTQTSGICILNESSVNNLADIGSTMHATKSKINNLNITFKYNAPESERYSIFNESLLGNIYINCDYSSMSNFHRLYNYFFPTELTYKLIFNNACEVHNIYVEDGIKGLVLYQENNLTVSGKSFNAIFLESDY